MAMTRLPAWTGHRSATCSPRPATRRSTSQWVRESLARDWPRASRRLADPSKARRPATARQAGAVGRPELTSAPRRRGPRDGITRQDETRDEGSGRGRGGGEAPERRGVAARSAGKGKGTGRGDGGSLWTLRV